MYFAIFLSLLAITSGIEGFDKNDCSCRMKASQKIVGGKVSEANAVPWQVSLKDAEDNHFCSGVIINEQWIATSWKCVEDKHFSEIYVRVALNKLNEPNKKEFVYYPEEIKLNVRQHAALIKLRAPIKFIQGLVEPGCLNDQQIEYQQSLVATGWGATEQSYKNEFSNVLKEASFVEDIEAECRSAYICVKEEKKGDSVCNGDEGGPLHYTQNGRTTVEGLLHRVDIKQEFLKKTYCYGTATFIRIVSYRSWLEQNVGKDHC